MPKFQEAVMALLKEREWTQRELAERIGRTPQHVSQLLNNATTPTDTTIRLFADAFGVDMTQLDDTHTARRRRRAAGRLPGMQGIEIEYLRVAMRALTKARDLLLATPVGTALAPAAGKVDTYTFDALTENRICQVLKEFNSRCAIITEEKEIDEHDRPYLDTLAYFVDPFDRSAVFADTLRESQTKQIRTVGEVVCMDEFPMCGVEAPTGSITCVRDAKIVFNVILDYAAGEVYVACAGMRKHGSIDQCDSPEALAEDGVDIVFNDNPEGDRCQCFIGPPGEKADRYMKSFKSLGFHEEQLPDDPKRRKPGGPARILYLCDDTDIIVGEPPAFILSNGERICEFIGWLAFAIHSSELAVFELYADQLTGRDEILLAPPPHYSVFGKPDATSVDRNVRIDIGRLDMFGNPSKYRGAIAIADVRSNEVASLRSMRNCRELLYHHSK